MGNEKKKLGRPKKDVVISAKERIRLWRENKQNREKEREKDRKRKKDQKENMTEAELEVLRAKNNMYKARHMNKVKETYSRQKKQGLVQRNKRKQAEYYKERKEESSTATKKVDDSRERVKAYRERQKLLVKMPFNSATSTRDMSGGKRRRLKRASEVAEVLTPTKKACLVKNIVTNLTPRTRREVVDSISPSEETDINMTQTFTQIRNKRDKVSNAARKIMVKSMAKSTKKKLNVPWRLEKNSREMDIEHILEVAKKTRISEASFDVRKRVQDFYNQDIISRVVPYKKATILVKNLDGKKERCCVRVMEMSLTKAYVKYKEENKADKISQRKFETLRPRNVRTQKHARRMVCGCPQHLNVDYVRNCTKRLMLVNKETSTTFDSNANLVGFTLCKDPTIKCYLRKCNDCGVKALDSMKTKLKYCSEKCKKEKLSCKTHTTKFHQYEQTEYNYKGNTKKKVALVDKLIAIPEMIDRMKTLLTKFALHRFNVEHTKTQIDSLLENLKESEIVKVQDFSENYKCLLPEEAQSIHWVQQSASLFPAVVVRNVDGVIREDHLLFFSNDLKHDVAFVEVVNDQIHMYYKEQGIVITRDFEVNDGCAAHFKSKTAVGLLSKRTIPTTRLWYESSHGKNASDGAGGHVKGALSYAVSASRKIIRNASEVYTYCDSQLSVEGGTKRMLCRKFFFVTPESLEEKRQLVKAMTYKPMKDTLKLHQATTTDIIIENKMYVRNLVCFCEPCYDGRYSECDILTNPSHPSHHIFQSMASQITYREHNFAPKKRVKKSVSQKKEQKKSVSQKEQDSETDSDSDEEDYDDSFEFHMASAVDMVVSGSIVVVRANDEYNSYYLLKVTSPPYTLQADEIDDYGNTFDQNTQVISGNYLETYGSRDDRKYYLDTTKHVFISTYCIAGISPELEVISGKRKRKDIDVYCVSPDIHEALMELCLSSVI